MYLFVYCHVITETFSSPHEAVLPPAWGTTALAVDACSQGTQVLGIKPECAQPDHGQCKRKGDATSPVCSSGLSMLLDPNNLTLAYFPSHKRSTTLSGDMTTALEMGADSWHSRWLP